MEPRTPNDDLQRLFVLPRELETSRPRDVRLSAGGIALMTVAVALFAAAVGVGIGLSRVEDRQAGERRAYAEDAVDTLGNVTRLWRTSGEKSRWMSYAYAIDGRAYEGRTKIGASKWTALHVGAAVPVRYLRADPGRSFAAGVQPAAIPLWLPFVVAAGLALGGWICLRVIRGQRQLLAEGRAAAATVTRHRKYHTQHGGTQQTFMYTFQVFSGAIAEGKGGPVSKAPAIGSVICVLYDPDVASRNSPYPLPLVRLNRT